MKSGEVYGIIINGRIEPSGGMTTNNYDRVYNKDPEQSIFSGILNRYKPRLLHHPFPLARIRIFLNRFRWFIVIWAFSGYLERCLGRPSEHVRYDAL